VNSNLMGFGVLLYASNDGPVVSTEPAWLPTPPVAALAGMQQAGPVKPPSTSLHPSSSFHARSTGWYKWWFWLPRPPSSSYTPSIVQTLATGIANALGAH